MKIESETAMENADRKPKNVLGVDFGLRNIGLAVSQGFLAEPLKTLKVESGTEATKKIQKIVNKLQIKKIVIGVSEGIMALKIRRFAKALRERIQLPVILYDETLTTKEAYQKMYQAGKSSLKRKKGRHMVAACLILQEYLDEAKNNC